MSLFRVRGVAEGRRGVTMPMASQGRARCSPERHDQFTGTRPQAGQLVDRYSERKERLEPVVTPVEQAGLARE